MSMQLKQRRRSAAQLPCSWSAPLVSHMQKSGFLMTRLIQDIQDYNSITYLPGRIIIQTCSKFEKHVAGNAFKSSKKAAHKFNFQLPIVSLGFPKKCNEPAET